MPRKPKERKVAMFEGMEIDSRLAAKLGRMIEQLVTEKCSAMIKPIQIQVALLEEDVRILQSTLNELEGNSHVYSPLDNSNSVPKNDFADEPTDEDVPDDYRNSNDIPF
jgi:hypothetical protein